MKTSRISLEKNQIVLERNSYVLYPTYNKKCLELDELRIKHEKQTEALNRLSDKNKAFEFAIKVMDEKNTELRSENSELNAKIKLLEAICADHIKEKKAKDAKIKRLKTNILITYLLLIISISIGLYITINP